MAPKKRTGFKNFFEEWRKKTHCKKPVMQAQSEANEIWKKMSPQEREKYKKAPPKKIKSPNVGTPLEEIDGEKKPKETIIKTIAATVKLAVDNNKLKNEKFYFIKAHYFINTAHQGCVPAEIAVAEFSLMDGVNRAYHVLVNPQHDMFGFAAEAQLHAKYAHQLPLPPNAMGERDMSTISSEILKFILKKDDGSYPPLYTHEENVSYVSSILLFISEKTYSEDSDLHKLNIYPMQELFYALKCGVCDMISVPKPEKDICNEILNIDRHMFADNIACDYHDEIDRVRYCAASHVYRWGFMFAENIANDLSIELKPGFHMPSTARRQRRSDQQFVNKTSDGLSKLSLK